MRVPGYNKNQEMNTDEHIPDGLSSEQEKVFKDLVDINARLTQQLKQIQVVVTEERKGRIESKNSSPRRERRERTVKYTKLVSVIREFCIECVGGSENNRKPWKAVRECSDSNCLLYSFRMGKNPFHQRKPAEG